MDHKLAIRDLGQAIVVLNPLSVASALQKAPDMLDVFPVKYLGLGEKRERSMLNRHIPGVRRCLKRCFRYGVTGLVALAGVTFVSLAAFSPWSFSKEVRTRTESKLRVLGASVNIDRAGLHVAIISSSFELRGHREHFQLLIPPFPHVGGVNSRQPNLFTMGTPILSFELCGISAIVAPLTPLRFPLAATKPAQQAVVPAATYSEINIGVSRTASRAIGIMLILLAAIVTWRWHRRDSVRGFDVISPDEAKKKGHH